MTISPKITKAVFPVAGLGTRFLPATKASPKEMLAVVDKPLIQYAVEEAVEAGINELIFVTGRNKRAIEDHFDKAYELEAELEANNKQELLSIVKSVLPPGVSCAYVRQAEPLGLGHAVLCAKRLIADNEHFAVILADDLIDASPSALSQMVDAHNQTGASIIGVEIISAKDTKSYGIVDTSNGYISNTMSKIAGIVEKPEPAKAPSNLAVVGRYILSNKIFDYLEAIEPGVGGEIQLTDGIARLLLEDPVLAYIYKGHRFDCGSKLGFLKANIEIGLKHAELGSDLKQYLAGLKLNGTQHHV